MGYDIRYGQRAKDDAEFYRSTYGRTFAVAFDEWLSDLADQAERQDRSKSIGRIRLSPKVSRK